MTGAAEKRARLPFSRTREKVSAKPTDEGLSSRALTLALTPTLSRKRERGRLGAVS
jgi:hypothetical protein